MKRNWFFMGLLVPLVFSGCYEEKVKEAASRLQVGVSRADLNRIFKDVKFLKEQVVVVYPNSTEAKTRASFIGNNRYDHLYPENVIDQLTFDGSTKILSYLIRRERIYANPTSVNYLAVFYHEKEDRVIGWASVWTSGDVDTWRNEF